MTHFRHVLEARLPQALELGPGRLHELVTLASLVEKETPDASERPIIAGIFERRIEKGWPLQCDPTVIYAIRLKYGLMGRTIGPLTWTDLAVESPYNTYRQGGLPPGPICSPGEASLGAALDPGPGDLLYFVSNNHGGHLFARTLAEHHRNVARYRREMAALRRRTSEAKNDAR